MKAKIRNSVNDSLPLSSSHYPATPKVAQASEGGSLNSIPRWRRPAAAGFLIPLALICFVFMPTPKAQAAEEDILPNYNTAYGSGVLVNLTTGNSNSGFGFEALNHDTTGNYNTAAGFRALFSNTGGGANAANGYAALYSNTGGFYNTATGFATLYANTTGHYNTANGFAALYYNTEGERNTATGFAALYRNIDGDFNVAVGNRALYSNTTGETNTANGSFALQSNTTGGGNTANGASALPNNTTGDLNVALGFYSGVNLNTGSGNVCIGAYTFGVAGESNTTRIRNIYTTLQPVVGTNPDYVTINSAGRLGRGNVSSRRYKHDIQPMDKASEALFKLKPVSFRYNKEYDSTQALAFGLIAEEVAEAYPDLVGRNAEGQPESVRYEQINAMLLNEFLKEHRKVEKLEAAVEQQRKDFDSRIAHQQKQIEALTMGLQKVSARLAAANPSRGGLEVTKPAPQMVDNNQ